MRVRNKSQAQEPRLQPQEDLSQPQENLSQPLMDRMVIGITHVPLRMIYPAIRV